MSAANQPATITGDTTGKVTEAATPDGVSIATGTLSATDPDSPVAFALVTGTTYGTFVIAPNGQWTYTLNNADPTVDALGATSLTLTDSAVVTSGDGTQKTITIAIAGVDDIRVGTDGDDTLTGTGGPDQFYGMGGNDTLIGGAGNDTYYVTSPGATIVETGGGGFDKVIASVSYALNADAHVEQMIAAADAGAVNLTGNGFAQELDGNAANNVLDGGGGADKMVGGDGDDTYYVDNVKDNVVEDSATGGNDTIYSSVSYGLKYRYVETLVLTGSANIDATGNNDANTLVSNAGNNVLDGRGGVDTASFANATRGVVANLATGKATGDGTDTLVNIENLMGSGFKDTLVGNAGANVLDGGAGADVLSGGDGNDTYYVDNAGDNVIEKSATGGNDTIYASASYSLGGRYVETLILTGGDAIDATGNDQSNTLVGNDAANVLDGKGGADTLTGGGGADTFVFSSAIGSKNVDTITDFAPGVDLIELDRSVFSAIASDGTLDPNAFVVGSSAQTADNRIVYNSSTGDVFYDADGSGSSKQIRFAHVDAGLALSASSFFAVNGNIAA